MTTSTNPVESIFFTALAKLPELRSAFLDEACGQDAELRDKVERLLAAQPQVGDFLELPAAAAVPPSVDPQLTTDARPLDTVGMVLAGKYKLLEEIGEGGMGSVWMAQQTEPVRRSVAVKLIKPGMDSKQVLARFDAERQALALMDHPNIAKVLDAGTTDESGRPFFVMELVKGVPITKYCDEHRLTPRQRLELFVPVCHAIQHAHQKGIIHRDIKPSNVLVVMYDDRPVPKVIDFGVAKATGQQLTEQTMHTGFGAVVGTVEYMSPEQASFNQLDVDTRSDIYSLGVLLYELLTGSPPFTKRELENAGMMEMLRVIREQEPSTPSKKLSTAQGLPTLAANRGTEPARLTKLVRGELDWIVMKALEKDRSRRYETANGFASDILHYLADETVQACPPSVGYRLRKFVRRNWGSVVAGTTLLTVLLIGIAGTSLGLIRAERARDDAVKAKNAEADQRQAAEKSDTETRTANTNLRDAREEMRINLYAARSNLIQSAWDAPGVGRMRELLEEQKPRDGERDLRGFEWHYWDRRANAELTVGQPASQDERARVSWRFLSPDGRRQAIIWSSRLNEQGDRSLSRIEVRDAVSGAPVSTFDLSIPIAGQKNNFAYPWLSFTSDSEGLFAFWIPDGEDRATIHWWLFEAGSGKELVGHREAPCEEMGLWLLGVSRALLATPVRVDGPPKGVRLKLWSVATGQEARTCDGTFAAIQRTAFRPDGKEVAAVVSTTAPDQQLVKVWDTATGRERLSLPAGSGYVRGLVWSPDGRRLCVASNPFRIWDAVEGRELLAMTEPSDPPEIVTFSGDGTRMACVEFARRFVTIKDTATGKTRTTLKTTSDTLIVGAAFTVDGRRLATLSRFGMVRTWDATTSDLPIELPSLAVSSHRSVAISPITSRDAAETRIATAEIAKDLETASLQVWDTSGRPLFATKRPCRSDKSVLGDQICEVVLSPDGRRAAWVFGQYSNVPKDGVGVRLTLIDLPSGKDLWSHDFSVVRGIRFSPDGRRLAAGAVWSSHDANKLASPTFKVLDVESGRETHSFPGGAGLFDFTGDSLRLAALGGLSPAGLTWKVWDLKDGRAIMSHPCPELDVSTGAGQLAISPDAKRLAVSWRTSDTAGIVRLFEVPSGRELHVLKGLDDWIHAVTFSPDGTRLAGAGGVVKIWDTASGNDLMTFRDLLGACGHLEFSPDGHRLHSVVQSNSKWSFKTWDATPRGMR